MSGNMEKGKSEKRLVNGLKRRFPNLSKLWFKVNVAGEERIVVNFQDVSDFCEEKDVMLRVVYDWIVQTYGYKDFSHEKLYNPKTYGIMIQQDFFRRFIVVKKALEKQRETKMTKHKHRFKETTWEQIGGCPYEIYVQKEKEQPLVLFQ